MELKKIDCNFSVCKLESLEEIDLSQEFFFIGKTDEEISLVCMTDFVPENVIEKEDGWKAFRIQGVLDFALIGILARISTILADNKIGIFVVSTYNTDYILVKEQHFDKALLVLEKEGYMLV